MKLTDRIRDFFIPRKMVRQELICGELPSSKEIYQTAFRIAWPSTLEAVLVGLVGVIDTIMVSALGSGAIAAVGLTNQPKMIVLATIMSLNVSVTAIVARRKGAMERLDANRCLRFSMLLSAVIAIVLSALGYFFARPMMIFAGAGEDVLDMAVTYFKIIMVGTLFNGLSMTINAAQRGAGNTKISMVTNLAANLVNMVFNYLLISGHCGFPALGVAGAAIATVIGSVVSLVIAIISLLYHDGFLSLRMKCSWLMDKLSLHSMASISLSAFVEQAFMRIGFFTYAKIVAGLGTQAFATHQIAMNAMSMSFTFGDGLSVACASLVGQNLGAKRPDLSIIYGKVGNRLALCISTVLSILFFTCAEPIMRLFTDEAEIIRAGIPLLYFLAFITYAQTSQVVFSGCLRGAGDTKFVAAVSFVSILFLRPLLSYVLCYPLQFGLIGALGGRDHRPVCPPDRDTVALRLRQVDQDPRLTAMR